MIKENDFEILKEFKKWFDESGYEFMPIKKKLSEYNERCSYLIFTSKEKYEIRKYLNIPFKHEYLKKYIDGDLEEELIEKIKEEGEKQYKRKGCLPSKSRGYKLGMEIRAFFMNNDIERIEEVTGLISINTLGGNINTEKAFKKRMDLKEEQKEYKKLNKRIEYLKSVEKCSGNCFGCPENKSGYCAKNKTWCHFVKYNIKKRCF